MIRQPRYSNTIGKQKMGFTLVELLVVIGIFTMITTIVAEYIFRSYEVNRFSLEMSDAVEYAKKGLEIMVKEIREASYGDNGDYPIAQANSQSITFYSDIDSDSAAEKVRYFLNGTNLIKGVTEPTPGLPVQYLSVNEATSTISQYIRNNTDPIFYFYNGNYPTDTTNNPLPIPVNVNSVRLMRLFLRININPAKAPGDFNLEEFVNLRNLKDNL